MQIKTFLRIHFTLVSSPKRKLKQITASASVDMGGKRTPFSLLVGVQTDKTIMQTSTEVSQKG